MPSGRRNSDPAPKPKAIGSAPRIAAKLVIMIGRKRLRQASRIASFASTPAACCPSAKSIIMMPFFLTMPISITMPMTAMTDKSMPANISAMRAPMPADGRPDRMVSGWI